MTVCESFCKSLKRHEAVVPKTESRKNKRKIRWTLNTSVNTRKFKNFLFTLLTLLPVVRRTQSRSIYKRQSWKKNLQSYVQVWVSFSQKIPYCGKNSPNATYFLWRNSLDDRFMSVTETAQNLAFPLFPRKGGQNSKNLWMTFMRYFLKIVRFFLFLMKNCWKNVDV